MNISLQRTPMKVIQRNELHFFKEFSAKCSKKSLKAIKFSNLQLDLSEFYDLFLEFVHLLYLSSFKSEPLYLSKVMVQKQQLTVFYFYSGQKEFNGFRRIERDNWFHQILLFWRNISEAPISDKFIKEYSVLWLQWKLWMDCSETEEQLTLSVLNNYQKQGYLQFIKMFYSLKITHYFNLELRIKQFIISIRMDRKERLPKLQNHHKLLHSQSESLSVKQQLQVTVQVISRLIYLLKQQNLVSTLLEQKGGLASDSEEDNLQALQFKTLSNRRSENYHFFLKIHLGQSLPQAYEKIQFVDNQRLILLSRKLIRVVISVERRDRICIKVTTNPFWKLYSSTFSQIKDTFEAAIINLSKQASSLKANPTLLNCLGLKLSYYDERQETKLSLSEVVSGALGRQQCMINVIQCIDKQLMLWAILQKYLQKSCRVYIDQVKEGDQVSIIEERLRSQIKKGIDILDDQLSIIFNKDLF